MNWDQYLSAKRIKESKALENFDCRNAFDSDLGRVTFSSAVRRMHDKTQVYPLTSGDYVHTRLTHSLEVMNIAKSFGIDLCRDNDFTAEHGEKVAYELEKRIPTILMAASLVHDIGNPPFGHYGENVIQDYFSKGKGEGFLEGLTDEEKLDFTQFDGNAQGFRLLTKTQYIGELYGLNLTYATLGAYLKYPNASAQNKDKKCYVGLHKHGVFESEKNILEEIATACNLCTGFDDFKYKRHPLAYLVEAADTICYRVMDLEDCLSLGLTSIENICKLLNGQENLTVGIDVNNPKKGDVVRLRVKLINYFVKTALNKFKENIDKIDNLKQGDYVGELLKGDKIDEIIEQHTREKYLNNDSVIQNELSGEAVISGILDKVLDSLIEHPNKRVLQFMSESMVNLCIHESTGAEPIKTDLDDFFKNDKITKFRKLHLAVDWVSGMTDKFACETYKTLSGMV